MQLFTWNPKCLRKYTIATVPWYDQRNLPHTLALIWPYCAATRKRTCGNVCEELLGSVFLCPLVRAPFNVVRPSGPRFALARAGFLRGCLPGG